jgi:hypothetical protein
MLTGPPPKFNGTRDILGFSDGADLSALLADSIVLYRNIFRNNSYYTGNRAYSNCVHIALLSRVDAGPSDGASVACRSAKRLGGSRRCGSVHQGLCPWSAA